VSPPTNPDLQLQKRRGGCSAFIGPVKFCAKARYFQSLFANFTHVVAAAIFWSYTIPGNPSS